MPGKTPVSILQEILSRRGTTPKYELVQIEGAIHEPTFRYRVTAADTVGNLLTSLFKYRKYLIILAIHYKKLNVRIVSNELVIQINN